MKNFKGESRKIGIELEFYGLSPKIVANELAQFFNGEVQEKHEALYQVRTSLGDFEIEIDAKIIKDLAFSSKKNKENNKTDFDGILKDIIKPISDEIVPTELITPPIEIKDIPKIVDFHKKLAEMGAQGTSDSFRFAFAAQLNPDVTSLEPAYILNSIRSFIMLSDWLKSQIFIDTTRRMTSFAADFPKDYILKIFNPDYHPNIDELIKDYLQFNPTRNRSLDMLPLFRFIDEKKIDAVVSDSRVKSRPTFHYRLPNCQISQKSWNINIEWRRWMIVEKLTDQSTLFEKMRTHFYQIQKGTSKDAPSDWLRECNNYIEELRA